MALSFNRAQAISYERGGISDSPGIVEKNHLQLELGYTTYERSLKASDSYNYFLGSNLWRYGLVDERFELRLFSPGLNINRNDINIQSLAPGFKIHLYDGNNILPSLEIISSFTIPFESRKSNYSHSYKFLISKNLTKKLNFLTNLTFSFDSFDFAGGREFTAFSLPYVFDLNYAVTEKLTLLAEVFGSWSLSSELGSSLGLAYGATYTLNNHIGFDITNYYGLNDVSTDFGLSMGMSYLF